MGKAVAVDQVVAAGEWRRGGVGGVRQHRRAWVADAPHGGPPTALARGGLVLDARELPLDAGGRFA